MNTTERSEIYTELASRVAHELNQPLMVIRSTSQYIQRLPKKEGIHREETRKYLAPLKETLSG